MYLHDGTVHYNVHIVAELEGAQVSSEGDEALVPEGPGEQVPSP